MLLECGTHPDKQNHFSETVILIKGRQKPFTRTDRFLSSVTNVVLPLRCLASQAVSQNWTIFDERTLPLALLSIVHLH